MEPRFLLVRQNGVDTGEGLLDMLQDWRSGDPSDSFQISGCGDVVSLVPDVERGDNQYHKQEQRHVKGDEPQNQNGSDDGPEEPCKHPWDRFVDLVDVTGEPI
ncbi:hypothetical protein WICPIJ_001576 [Wickerhamomyces pijperi]|uniref:Uncharacterized protein n=1 Tax=Wickerhamomyces pijperi TaxID=599730 RepID=A0A9P8TQH8_WICPI|nr:hypothetical protein WICPIJ_001576 [Wickerhamomyces pijperi]